MHRSFIALHAALWAAMIVALFCARRLPAAALVRCSLRAVLLCNATVSVFLCVGGAPPLRRPCPRPLRAPILPTLSGLPASSPVAFRAAASTVALTRLPPRATAQAASPLPCPDSGALFPDIACTGSPAAASAAACAGAHIRSVTIVMTCQTILMQARLRSH